MFPELIRVDMAKMMANTDEDFFQLMSDYIQDIQDISFEYGRETGIKECLSKESE